jgi:hypothetical protein
MTESTLTSGEETTPNNEAEANWKDALPEEVREDPSMEAIQTVDNLAKSYVNAQKMIGTDKIMVPNKYAEENEWNDVFKKLGLPEKPDDYDINFTETEDFDKDFFSNFKNAAHGAGILPKQAQKLFDWYTETNTQLINDYQTQREVTEKQATDNLKSEWGSAYDSKLKAAQAAVNHYGDDGLTSFLDETGLGNNPNLIKAFAKMGESLSEDSFTDGNSNKFGITPQDAQAQINSIMADSKHPYHDKYNPSHTNAVSEVQRLFQYLG